MSHSKKIIIVESEENVVTELCSKIEKIASKSIIEDGRFIIGLSGGSLIKYLCSGLPKIKTDWTKWILAFCDERIVPTSDADSTFGLYKNNLIGKVELEESQFIVANTDLSPKEAAEDYTNKLKILFGDCDFPKFDLLLLGMGPDGHTCSLFPEHDLLNEKTKWVASIIDSPKPPPERITLTFPVINNAKCCIFAMAGASKADMVERIHVNIEDLPAGRVNLVKGEVFWIMDNEASRAIANRE